ncbi:MAG: DUF559 domain-containing protein [Gordonia sp. (in: high G+C Gram-positive bacteria)]|uniref:endonuclease domain-containing protein n=1 Tax=Gordonia sp. (in: high G+C Gram-positive bacteria) TaxID=84139 RepID=UPI003BB54658
MDIPTVLTAGHGVASWRNLQKAGMTRTDRRKALAAGALLSIRRGWYKTATADARVVSSVAAGGVCTCISALRLHGVWIPEGHHRTHTRARPHTQKSGVAGPPKPCRRYGRPVSEDCAVDDVPTALAHAVRCVNDEELVVLLDSIMNLRLMSRDEIEAVLRPAPVAVQRLLDRTAQSQAGTETMVRFRLQSRNIRVRSQVCIPGVGIVDLLVGDRLIVEVDGEQFHHSTEQFHKDRSRDAEALRLGYLSLRLTYRSVVHEWRTPEAVILAVVRRGDHLASPVSAELIAEPEDVPDVT